MESLILAVQLIILAGFGALVFFAKNYLPSYSKEKGKNLATKEDIGQITDKIESVKVEYAKELEGLKSQLNAKFHAHTIRYEKEFQVLAEVWSRLIEFSDAAAAFQPGIKSGSSDESEEQKRFGQARFEFLRVIDCQKPFFPQEIVDLLDDYHKRQYRDINSVASLKHQGYNQSSWVIKFADHRDENLKEIGKLADEVCEAIRKRVVASHTNGMEMC